jgi:hypothetical protein
MRNHLIILALLLSLGITSCGNNSGYEDADKSIETDPSDYDRGMREEEAAPATDSELKPNPNQKIEDSEEIQKEYLPQDTINQ